jgi:2-oxoacid:acceptor oxidoreductase gamma subunit (pyruvate/2-ketoisovalerate family)
MGNSIGMGPQFKVIIWQSFVMKERWQTVENVNRTEEVSLEDPGKIIEIRWHGRGGQGAVTSAEIMAEAAISEGKFAQAFPSFGPERRGAPVQAYVRISADQAIRNRSSITDPDVVVVLDPGLLRAVNVAAGLKPGGIIIINTIKTAAQIRQEFKLNVRLATVGATKIALEQLGVPITNTTMIGAVLKVTEAVKMESLVEPINTRFGRLAEKNISAFKRAYAETIIEELAGDKIRR